MTAKQGQVNTHMASGETSARFITPEEKAKGVDPSKVAASMAQNAPSTTQGQQMGNRGVQVQMMNPGGPAPVAAPVTQNPTTMHTPQSPPTPGVVAPVLPEAQAAPAPQIVRLTGVEALAYCEVMGNDLVQLAPEQQPGGDTRQGNIFAHQAETLIEEEGIDETRVYIDVEASVAEAVRNLAADEDDDDDDEDGEPPLAVVEAAAEPTEVQAGPAAETAFATHLGLPGLQIEIRQGVFTVAADGPLDVQHVRDEQNRVDYVKFRSEGPAAEPDGSSEG